MLELVTSIQVVYEVLELHSMKVIIGSEERLATLRNIYIVGSITWDIE